MHLEQCESLYSHFSSVGLLRAQLCMQGQSISINESPSASEIYSKEDMLDILRGSHLYHLATFLDLEEKDMLLPPFLSDHLCFERKNDDTDEPNQVNSAS